MEPREYQRLAEVEDGMWWFRGLRANLLWALIGKPLSPGARILDAGSGTGGLLSLLGESFPAAQRIGLDISPDACRMAARKSGAPIVAASVDRLPLADGSLDAVLSADVLCHAAVDQARALEEFRRCLAPRGRLVLNLPAYQWMLSAHDHRVHNVRRYTRSEILRLLEGAGFANARAFYWNSLLFPLMMAQRLVRSRKGAESDVEHFPPLVDRIFGGVLALERALLRNRLRLPFGGSILAVAERK